MEWQVQKTDHDQLIKWKDRQLCQGLGCGRKVKERQKGGLGLGIQHVCSL